MVPQMGDFIKSIGSVHMIWGFFNKEKHNFFKGIIILFLFKVFPIGCYDLKPHIKKFFLEKVNTISILKGSSLSTHYLTLSYIMTFVEEGAFRIECIKG